ncbi:PREDICTED: MATH and LRR domain-containing protein PFE0570w-like [Ceratosolen solmsi marchali]|uniref:MATH and LRR domain-containing protein PFE0570w-like n=1 Tax=Ceratosolen solmsi marchali TaxID=326594 RepID=A0AAJ6YUJ7_9HYME|nr:PREDICTED: MATH and LRR domain-containing protein PFE0570w-like [Ceratosolen solmsi marchali]
MPRVIRDSDDEVETKSCIRRTRASAAASIQDSPLRRNTRSSKQLCTIESSPESLNDSNIQPIGPTTRSRIATLDKGMAVNIVKSLRSRKNSGSSDVSEIIEVENDTIEKRVTRRNKAGQSLSGTPTKANLRSRNIRAGSEAKSTPPASRSRRVTRSSSVDPIGNLNDSLGTPVKRRTRASIVPTQPTVTEDEEIKNIDSKSLQNTVIEINENDSEISMVFNKEKSNRNSLNNAVDANKNISVKEIFNNSEKFALDSSKKLEDSMTYKSNNSNETIEESTNKSLTILSVYSILDKNNTNTLSNNSNLNDDESERVDVEVCDSRFTNESIQINDLEYKDELNLDKIELNIKDSYVKLNRTNVVEKLLNQKKDESKTNNADGAFTPAKTEDNEEANKYHKSQENSFENEEITNNQTHKIESDDSDSDNSLGKLFQDIPAEEWCHQTKQNRSSFSEVSNENENEVEITMNNASKNKKDSSFKASMIQEDNLRTKKNRKSFEEKQTNKSLEYKSRDSLEKDTNQSHLYRIRKSYETKSENNQSMTFNDTVSKKINSEIQECNTAEIEDENESPNKRPLSINKSLKTNQSSYDQTDESISDKMSSSINENKSLQKSHTSIDTSLRLNQSSFEENENKSISEEFTNSVNNSKIITKQFTSDTLCKSLMEQSNERLSYEVMDVDEEKNESREIYNKSLNESKDLKKSPFNKSVSKNKSISDNGINYSVPAKHLSTNNSISSLDEHQNQDKSFNDEVEMIEDIDTDKNENDETNNKLEKKYRKSLNKSNLSNQLNQSDLRQINGSLKEKLSDSLNKSKKLKNRLSGRLQPLNDSSNKLLSKNQCLKSESDNEIEENDEKLSNKQTSINLSKSSNDISLNLSKHNESTVSNVKNEISLKNKLLKNTHNKLAIQSDSDEDISSETNNEIINTNNKSLNISSKSSMSIHNSSVKSIPSSFSKNSTTENTENTDESVSNDNLNKTEEASINYGNGQNQMNLDNSIPKNSEMIKFPNLMKQDVSSTTQLESDSGNREIPEYQLHMTDEESDTSEEDKENSCSKEIDSDIAKEYNLSGKSIKKYSDDDVPGDDCREFSDDDDDGNDLTDFIVPDDQVEQSEDESDDEESDNEDDSEDNEINEAQALHSVKEESLNNLKLNKNESLNNSKLKNNASFNKSNSIKDKSTLQNLSKSVKSETPESRKSITKDSKSFNDKRSDTSESEYSESLNSDTEEITKNVTSDTNKNMNIASPSSESESESEDGEDSYHVITVDQTNTSCSRSVSSKTKKVTPLIECSTPKPGVIKKNDFSKGADSFADSHNLPIAVNKSNFTRHKSESLNDLSDTKIVSSRMSIAEVASKSNHDNSVKFKESIETDDREELTGSIIKNRQAWKLIPLNQTAYMLSNETPVTKYLKKSKLNDSAPDSEIRRSGVVRAEASLDKSDLTNKKSIKKFKKMQESDEGEEEEAEEKKKAVVHTSLNDRKSKKRKLHDISNPTSSNEDSILKTTKKKRARIEESIIEEASQLQIENKKPENVQKKKKKEINDKNLKTEEYVVEATEPDVMKVAQQGKKKKKKKKKNNDNNNKNNNNMEIDQSIEEIAVPDIVKDAQQTKKEKKNKCKEVQQQLLERSQSTDDKKMKKNKEKQQAKCIHKNKQEGQEVSNIEVTKQKKKKVRSNDDRFDQKQLDVEPMKSQIKSNVTSDTRNQQQPKQLKKKKRLIDEDVDDENAPESMGFEEARSSVLTAMQREVEAIRAQKLARRKKQKIEPTAPAEKTSLKRLPDKVLKALTDESTAKKSSKQRKKPKNKADAKVAVPSTSMFSPGKKAPANLEVDDGYVSLNLDGGTTQFGVVNLEKAKKFTKKNAAVISFREKMLSRNLRQPTATYLMYLKKQKSKTSL